MSSRTLAAVVVMTLVAMHADAAPRASFVARPLQGSTCVAPCAVHFDAIGMGVLSASPFQTPETTDPGYARPFHSLLYQWDFGDPTSGTWQHSGVSKNTDIGPVAGHVYANPGTYTVTLRVSNPAGETNATTRSVTVVSPASAFTPAQTFCFANTAGNWSGCPLNCAGGDDNCTVTNDYDMAMTAGDNCSGTGDCANADQNRVRVLFRRGDRFTNGNGLGLDLSDSSTSPAMIEPFGTGADPVIQGAIDTGAGWTVTGIRVEGGDLSIGAYGDRPYNNATYYRMSVNNNGPCFNFGVDGGDPESKKLDAFVEVACMTTDVNWMGGHYTLFMGNTVDHQNIAAPSGNHYTMRTGQFQHLVFAHNFFTRNDPQGNHWQFRASDAETAWSANEEASAFNLIHDNLMNLNASTTAWIIRVCNDSGCNCVNGTCSAPDFGQIVDVHDWIFERNLYRFENGQSPGQLEFFQLTGGDMTVRNEIISFGTAIPNQGLSLVSAVGQTARTSGSTRNTNVHVFNNTIYASGAYNQRYRIANSNTGFGATGCTAGCLTRNNLIVFTNGGGSALDPSPGFISLNDRLDNDGTDPFEGAMPPPGTASRESFVPMTTEASVVNAGYSFTSDTDRSVINDARGLCRTDTRWDIGAVERGAPPCPNSSQPPPAALLAPTLLAP